MIVILNAIVSNFIIPEWTDGNFFPNFVSKSILRETVYGRLSRRALCNERISDKIWGKVHLKYFPYHTLIMKRKQPLEFAISKKVHYNLLYSIYVNRNY